MSARREPFATPNDPSAAPQRNCSFPKEARLLRRADFQQVYEKGRRVPSRYFVAYCLSVGPQPRGRVGIAVPRALGSSVVRNRIKRRLREAVRLNLDLLGQQWNIVLQARKPALEADFAALIGEVQRLFSLCAP
ncbi:MAG: ribonuclease P protein component [Bryobacteraceae bacterium]